ncbi:glycoside hydrolase N-terminal domain-containing protein [Cellvibrio sp. KY-YJ-3]|uniref:glycoside hydrolase family 95 protein n=1 Tax=Cellvibrio sp. KY-YJ-3 TaxID=454662 RepID=UPI0012472815|nr:glycoside hydrolase family 95 protein [Cellvibrio sp. KY-YJ-3]QEY12235.1 glycoside hydrolase family 95 protein [Cellvibrio sp. KY-YJ-3]
MKFRTECFFITLIIFCFSGPVFASSPLASSSPLVSPHTLWYEQSAQHWEEALPLGNGRLGAMVYGGVANDNIQLNENTFWAGGPHNNVNPKALESLPEIRRLITAGEYLVAEALAEKTITSQGSNGMPYQTAGNLHLEFPAHKQFSHYYRDLHIGKAIATTRYQVGDVVYTREVFSSFVDQVIVVKLSASKPGQLSFTAHLSHPATMQFAQENNHTLLMQGMSKDHEGIKGQVKLATLVDVNASGGSLSQNNNRIAVNNADSALILISMATNFVNYKDISGDALARARNYLASAKNQFTHNQYTARKHVHSNFYKQYFDRVALQLGKSEFAQEPTDQRIRLFASRHDPELASLYFQFGRYLLISGSQPGGQPTNLQGIWNHRMDPPWDSKYTLNINAEMNYWPSEVTQLNELNEPFIQMVKELAQTGQQTAKEMYGARGWMAHHNTDIWRITGGIDKTWGSWPTSNAWLSQHLWEKYLYSGDKTYLADVYPVMKSAVTFFEDFLIESPDKKWLIVSPSMSPENAPTATGVKIAAGVTMDNQLLFDLLSNTIAAAEILGQDKTQIPVWKKILSRLPPMQIGKHHQLQEWLEDWDEPQDKHRHVSHLYGLYPSNQISPLTAPELFSAARVTMEQRGDPSTGWSMNWKINLWARLLDGDRALKLMREQISPAMTLDGSVNESGGTYPNMFDAHPPFQIDGNFGFTSGMAEMLAQSHDGAVHLLPALPQAWPEGEVKGLLMRGGFVVDMRWANGQIRELKIHSRLGGNLRLRTHSELPAVSDFKTKKVRGTKANPNPFYARAKIKTPLKNTGKVMPLLSLANTYVIDVPTQAGRDYYWAVK